MARTMREWLVSALLLSICGLLAFANGVQDMEEEVGNCGVATFADEFTDDIHAAAWMCTAADEENMVIAMAMLDDGVPVSRMLMFSDHESESYAPSSFIDDVMLRMDDDSPVLLKAVRFGETLGLVFVKDYSFLDGLADAKRLIYRMGSAGSTVRVDIPDGAATLFARFDAVVRGEANQ